MSQPGYYGLFDLIRFIENPNRDICVKILDENRDLFLSASGSTINHQAWPGGYLDHVQETMNIAVFLYTQLNVVRPLPFKLSDAMLVLFLHDLEKPWKGLCHLDTKRDKYNFRFQKIEEYKISITPEQENALKYIESEGNDYTNHGRVMNPLAAFCHLADTISARIWFDHPKDMDAWVGAHRYS